tara:strand:+ start:841 stop:1236 length:396 start_codon:yes stop_codon:yes gene_type:complete
MDTLNEWMSFLGCAKRIDNYKKSILKEVDPNYVQDLYGIVVKVAMSKMKGGEVKQTTDEIKGIHEVTIVNTVPGSTSTDKANHYATLFIKFELTGGKDPVIFKESILIPSMITIPGLSIVYVGDMRPIERD